MIYNYKRRIYYHDTDCGGIVYYASYLKFLEEARTNFFEHLGVSVKELAENEDTLFVVARQEIDYKKPSYYGDVLTVKTWIEEIGKIKLWFNYAITNEKDDLIANAKTLMVCVDKKINKKKIPDNLINILKSEMIYDVES